MRSNSTSLTGTGTKVMPVDNYVDGFLVTCAVTGTATYTVSLTNDNVLKGDTPDWFAITALSNKTTSEYASVVGGVTAFQLEITAGTGTVKMTVSSARGDAI